jgi:integrase
MENDPQHPAKDGEQGVDQGRPSPHDGPNRTAITELSYIRTAMRIIQNYEIKNGRQFDTPIEDFRQWINGTFFSGLERATRRQYRAALSFYMEANYPRYKGIAAPRPYVRHNPPLPKRTSALKKKYVDEQRFTSYLASSTDGDNYNGIARTMMIAGIAFGLRPQEWFDTEIKVDDDGRTRLIVKNAKHTNNRAHGDHRTLWVDATVHQHSLGAAAELIQLLKDLSFIESERMKREGLDGDDELATAKIKEKIIRQSGAALRRTLIRLKMKGAFTLYSARHQFAANGKAAGLSLIELAALMGHASTETASTHYGKRRAGRSGVPFGVEADQGDMERVIESMPKDAKASYRASNKPSTHGGMGVR